MSELDAISVYVVILNFNNSHDTVKCVDSLMQMDFIPSLVLVVDNGSCDNSFNKLKEIEYNCVEIIKSEHNLGFSGGINYGINYLGERSPDFYWFLNNDTLLEKSALSELLGSAYRCGKNNLYSSKIYYSGNKNKVYYDGFFINHFNGEMSSSREKVNQKDCDDLFCDTIQGASLLVSYDIASKYGLMDDGFFLYFEEFDYALRLREHGVRSVCSMNSVVFHDAGVEEKSRGMFEVKTYYRLRNKIIFWKRHFKKRKYIIYVSFLVLKQLKLLCSPSSSGKRAFKSRMTGLIHGINGTFGKYLVP